MRVFFDSLCDQNISSIHNIFIISQMIILYRSRTSTDSSSMATTPSSGKESSSTTGLEHKSPVDVITYHQKEMYSVNGEVSNSAVSFHRRLFNGQKCDDLNRSNTNQNIIHNEKVKSNHKRSSKDSSSRSTQLDNSLPIGRHHFSLQSLLEALPAESVDTTTVPGDPSTKPQNRDSDKLNKRASLSSLSTNGSRASGEFDGFFYI